MSESMIERVARALHARRYGEWYEGPLKMTDSQRACWADACVAIEAMRQPTDAMVRVGRKKIPAGHGQAGIYTGEAYTAMIDAALTEHANAR